MKSKDIKLILAARDAKGVGYEWSPTGGLWWAIHNFSDNDWAELIRTERPVRKESKMVLTKWELADVPMGAKIRDPRYPQDIVHIIGKGTFSRCDAGGGFSAVFFDRPLQYHGTHFGLGDLLTYIGKIEHSVDDGLSWHRCGKMVPIQ